MQSSQSHNGRKRQSQPPIAPAMSVVSFNARSERRGGVARPGLEKSRGIDMRLLDPILAPKTTWTQPHVTVFGNDSQHPYVFVAENVTCLYVESYDVIHVEVPYLAYVYCLAYLPVPSATR
jgi:hypothetical protein